jgi:hypothetical protein
MYTAFIMHKPATLRLPQPEYIETDDGRYRIEPIARQLGQFNAGSYAKACHALGSKAWQVAPWAISAEPDDERRRALIAEHYNPANDKFMDEAGHRIAQAGRYMLTIGLFDVTTDELMGHPATLRGFVQPNLEVSGNTAEEWQKRHATPDKVYPSLGGGPELSVELPDQDRELLYGRLFAAALNAFDPEDIGSKHRNTLDVYMATTDAATMVRLGHRGALNIEKGVAPSKYVGSPQVRMQFPDLAALQQVA